jgi:polyribonucleotide nucleotidyltransferase
LQPCIDLQLHLQRTVEKGKMPVTAPMRDAELEHQVRTMGYERLRAALTIEGKLERQEALQTLENEIMQALLGEEGESQEAGQRSKMIHIPADLVVNRQAIDIVEVISSLIWPRNIVQTSCRTRKWRYKPRSRSEVHRSTTKSAGM